MTNKEFQEILKQFPDNMEIAIYREVMGKLVLCANPQIQKLLDLLVLK